MPAKDPAQFCRSPGSEVGAVLLSILDLHKQLHGSAGSRDEVHIGMLGDPGIVGVAAKGQTQGVLQIVIMGTSQQKFLLQVADGVRFEQVFELDVQVQDFRLR